MPASPAQLREQTCTRALKLLETLDLPAGTALVATGSLSCQEMAPYSDLDLILIYELPVATKQIEKLWYPIWDAALRLDYAVRTPSECVDMITADPTAALAMLDMSYIRGDKDLAEKTRKMVLHTWRTEVKKNFNSLVDTAIVRWRRSGSLVTMTRPDLKHGRGGLRDIDLIQALALANLCDRPKLHVQRQLLLDTRTLLHLHARRARDILDPEFAADIALDLGYHDRYALAQALVTAARTIDQELTQALSIARNVLPRRESRLRQIRRPIDVDVVEVNGKISLSKKPDLTDPMLFLRVGAASARTGLPIDEAIWHRLERLPELPEILPAAATADVLGILSSAEHGGRVISHLDNHGLWTRVVPEWAHIRGRMPFEPTHIHTIDQHSLVVVAGCAAQSVTVARPDLLYLAALFHDIGKGYARPHEEVGAEIVDQACRRCGLREQDRRIVVRLVAQHTLASKIIARMDYTSDKALNYYLDALGYDLTTINLMEVLVEADAQATGPGVFSHSLRVGIRSLSRRARQRLTAVKPEPPLLEWPHTTNDVVILHSDDVDKHKGHVYWRGNYLREIVRVLAVIGAKSWNVESAEIVTTPAGVMTHLTASNALGSEFDQMEFVQTYKSGTFSTLPIITGATTATFWQDDIIEVRTADRPGALGVLLSVLPDIYWLRMSNPGATMIVQCRLQPGFVRAQVERDVTKKLASG
ncbi:[protein-PII] uridylyltransferase [Corynebacterium kutscheri]|uniref:[protein-PII] uridylyltransferase n=1 Tax=Corynebacterium kutscheri TaxID=35755 RepID=UPI0037C0C5D1